MDEDASIPEQKDSQSNPDITPPESGDVEKESNLINHDDAETASPMEKLDSIDGARVSESEDESDEEIGSDSNEGKKQYAVLNIEKQKHTVSDYKSLLSEFDDYVASEKMGSGITRALSYGFTVGDLVWGKVKSHPWWPGHIFNEAFASPSVRRMRKIDHVLVAFFGDSSYGWFDPAELIPFDLNLVEKAKQTVSKQFVRAVEEAVEEASRRSAVGLSCKCRNPFNFRVTNVKDYYAVDVPDYEVQSVYSGEQIKKFRDEFSPVEMVGFVKGLGLAAEECDYEGIEFLKKKAMVGAFRKAVFEEFDETYSQALSGKSTKTSASTVPPRAPLSGPLVIAETLGDLKGSKKPAKVIKDSKKHDKYVGDKTVEASSMKDDDKSGIVSMDFNSSSVEECSVPKISSVDAEKSLVAGEYKMKMEEEPEQKKSEAMSSLKQETGTDTVSVVKKAKVTKRSSSEMGFENPPMEPKLKKKKKKDPNNSDHPEKRKVLVGPKKLSQLGSVQLQEVDVPQVLSHLKDLSLDPFSGSSDTSFGTARKFFLGFRTLKYQKSLSVSSSSAENAKDTKPSKLVKTVNKAQEGPSKAGKKRLSSDRQEEIPSAKKKLKKTIASEKKTSRDIKPVREQTGTVQAKPAKAQTGKKTSPPVVKVAEPTMLVMKFPPGTSLPSNALLKARFCRFGCLDQSAVRVFWKSSTCRVVFLYKADAQRAFGFATNNSMFGNVNVRYFLRDVDAPKPEPQEQENALDDEPPNRTPPRHQPTLPPPNINLKSCLKKPLDDPSSSSNRGNVRVKFMLGGEENLSKAKTFSSRESGPSSSSSSSVGMEFVSKKIQNVLPPSTLPPILPLPPQYAKPQQLPIKTVEHHVKPPMPPPRNYRGGGGSSQAVGAGDISHQMLNLLSKCNDVVANVTGLLGYVPYHPL